MYLLAYLCGWALTVAVATLVRVPGRAGLGRAAGLVFAVAAALLWPVTLWIVLGTWWRRRAATARRTVLDTGTLDARIEEARSFARDAEREDMPASQAYWSAELERLIEQRDAGRIASSREKAASSAPRGTPLVVLGCILGAALTTAGMVWAAVVSVAGPPSGSTPPLGPAVQARPVAHSAKYTYHVEGNHRMDSVVYTDSDGRRVTKSYFMVDPSTSGAPLPWTLSVAAPPGGGFDGLLAESASEVADNVLTCRITDQSGAVVAAQTKQGPLAFCLVTVGAGGG